MSSTSIFISYRREDTASDARLLYTDLKRRFGQGRVFMDVESIGAGSDYRKDIQKGIASCTVLLVVIGRSWLSIADGSGKRRLDDPNDAVRLEVLHGLELDQVTVVPALVGNAAMPTKKDLPDELAELAFRNAVTLSHNRWNSDFEVLVAELAKFLPLAGETDGAAPEPTLRQLAAELREEKRSSLGRNLAIAAVAVAIGVGGYVGYDQLSPVRIAEREARIAELKAREKKAEADEIAAVAAAALAKAQLEQAEADRKKRESEQSAAAASAAQAAAEQAAREAAEKANAQDRAIAEAKAKELAEAQALAKKKADEEAAEAERLRVAAAEASRAAAEKVAKDERAQVELATAAAQVKVANQKIVSAGGRNLVAEVAPVVRPAALGAAARGVTFEWRQTANCGGRIEARGPATFLVERDGDGVFVGARLKLSSGAYSAQAEARQRFDKPQDVYPLTLNARWTGPREFTTTQPIRVIASAGGTAFSRADGGALTTQCTGGG